MEEISSWKFLHHSKFFFGLKHTERLENILVTRRNNGRLENVFITRKNNGKLENEWYAAKKKLFSRTRQEIMKIFAASSFYLCTLESLRTVEKYLKTWKCFHHSEKYLKKFTPFEKKIFYLKNIEKHKNVSIA